MVSSVDKGLATNRRVLAALSTQEPKFARRLAVEIDHGLSMTTNHLNRLIATGQARHEPGRGYLRVEPHPAGG